jgi:GxxExxY protein
MPGPSTPHHPLIHQPSTTFTEYNQITSQIISSAVKVHRALGPGLLESAYSTCLAFDLRRSGLFVQQQVPLPIVFEDVRLEVGYRVDLLVERMVMVEVKSLATLLPIHEAQLLSYLRLSGCRVGLLLNFHVPVMREGIRRLVNGLAEGADRSVHEAPR